MRNDLNATYVIDEHENMLTERMRTIEQLKYGIEHVADFTNH